LRGPGLGSWERLGHHQFEAHFKFFLFNPNFSPRGSDEVTSHIHLTGPDAFEATATSIFSMLDMYVVISVYNHRRPKAWGKEAMHTGIKSER